MKRDNDIAPPINVHQEITQMTVCWMWLLKLGSLVGTGMRESSMKSMRTHLVESQDRRQMTKKSGHQGLESATIGRGALPNSSLMRGVSRVMKN